MVTPDIAATPTVVPVSLNGRGYQIEFAELIRRPAASPTDEFDQGSEPGERITIVGAHRRLGKSFTGGAGQELYDDEDSNRSRYWVGLGIVTHVPNKFMLDTTVETGTTVSNGASIVSRRSVLNPGPWIVNAAAGPSLRYVYWMADVLQRATTPGNGAPEDISGIAVALSLAARGGYVYIATGSDLRRTPTSATTDEQVCAQDCDLVGYANGHLLIGHDEAIYEVTDLASLPSVPDELWTNPDSGNWTAICETPGAIYAAYLADNGASTVYVWADVTEDSTLGVPTIAAPLEDFEQVFTMVCVGGNVLALGTSAGLRLAQITAAGPLEVGPIVQPLRNTASTSYRFLHTGLALVGSGLYAAVSTYVNEFPGGITTAPFSVVRYDMATFVGPLQPAYTYTFESASGIVPSPPHETTGQRGYTTWNHTVVVNTGSNTTSVSWVPLLDNPETAQEDYDRAAAGSYASGWVTLGKPESHQPIEVVVYHEPLPTGSSLSVALMDPAETVTTLTGTAEGDTATVYDATTVDPGRRYMVVITLTRGTDPTKTPVVLGWGYRAQVLSATQDEIILPIKLGERVMGNFDTVEVNMNPADEFATLKALEGQIVEYVEGSRQETVQVVHVGWNEADVVSIHNTDRTRAGFTGVCRVRMVTVV
jgi:hypothetical protein